MSDYTHGNKWCTIESDPGVFTELIRQIGVKGVQVEELITLDDEELNQVKPIYGLIFLFKWVQDTEKRDVLSDYDPELFFANQVINNACATQAILSILMNKSKELELGSELKNLRDFSIEMSSKDRGWAIGNSEPIRIAHNSFSRQEPFEIEYDKKSSKEEDAFHFIAYTPFKGTLYELDGLQHGPISHGPATEENWLSVAREQIMSRIQKYEASEIRFNLLAVTGDKRELAEKECFRLKLIRKYIHKQLGIETDESMDDFSSVQNEIEELSKQNTETMQAYLNEIEQSINNQEIRIQTEIERDHKWKVENERRKHNYVPFIFELL
jgi:ubiquitin carboxyl-terminal hydrolase L5